MESSKPLVREAYMMLYREAENNNTINNNYWAAHVRHLLNTMGFGHVWLHQGVGNKQLFKKKFEQHISDTALQTWSRSLNGSSDAHLYRELKTTIEYSAYLNCILQPKYRYQLVKFRTRNHKLAVVTGKWHKPRPIPYQQRLCTECNQIEDEGYSVFFIFVQLQ